MSNAKGKKKQDKEDALLDKIEVIDKLFQYTTHLDNLVINRASIDCEMTLKRSMPLPKRD